MNPRLGWSQISLLHMLQNEYVPVKKCVSERQHCVHILSGKAWAATWNVTFAFVSFAARHKKVSIYSECQTLLYGQRRGKIPKSTGAKTDNVRTARIYIWKVRRWHPHQNHARLSWAVTAPSRFNNVELLVYMELGTNREKYTQDYIKWMRNSVLITNMP